MSKQVALYARVSTQGQGEDGKTSIPEQLRDCQRLADERSFTVVEVFKDTASGYTLERPALDALRDAVQRGRIQVVICYSLDRLCRDSTKSAWLEHELARRGVQIEYVTGQYDNTPQGKLQKNMMRALADAEGDILKDRMRRGKMGKLRNGSVMLDTPPYGYKKEAKDGKNTLVINEAEAQVVGMVFQWFVFGDETDPTTGPLTIEAIKNRLYTLQIPTRTDTLQRSRKNYPRANVWSNRTVYDILRNTTYIGRWAYGKTKKKKVETEENGRVRLIKKTERVDPKDWLYVDVERIIDDEMY